MVADHLSWLQIGGHDQYEEINEEFPIEKLMSIDELLDGQP